MLNLCNTFSKHAVKYGINQIPFLTTLASLLDLDFLCCFKLSAFSAPAIISFLPFFSFLLLSLDTSFVGIASLDPFLLRLDVLCLSLVSLVIK